MKTITPILFFLAVPLMFSPGLPAAPAGGWSERQAASAAQTISEARYDARAEVVAIAERQAERGAKLTETLAGSIGRLNEARAADLRIALDRVDKARGEFVAAIGTARTAPERRWDSARDDLAESYSDYDTLLRQAHAVVTVGAFPVATP